MNIMFENEDPATDVLMSNDAMYYRAIICI